ncbi:uncharacterized protein FA14DRAFT_161719 [Meira miltonrushii]|uniref:Plastocyanin-like domain-containing protein n=1 Tax=Meira miltonrushii TaxID=1280837 RepID=A0A316V9J4_9BASI|nr:uncharacterized protein FA14DRAFT_161719 [Meira miltonrushii]PWN34267.1 hypothetical protein FA14DRAFT_161719 [Meira miltonrushii]
MNQKPGAYFFHAEQATDMFAYTPASLITMQSAVLRYAGIPDSIMPDANVTTNTNVTQSLDDSTLVPLIPQIAPLPSKQDTLSIAFSLASDNQLYAFLNDTSWSATPGDATLYDVVSAQRQKVSFTTQQLVITNDDVVVWDLIWNNEDDGDHPVHLHGYNPWILGSGQGHYQYGKSLNLSQTFDNPMRRDTFRVPVYGWAAIRVVLNNPGIWALHCHIGWHMEVGFLTQLNVLPSKLAQQTINPYAAAQCGKASLASS